MITIIGFVLAALVLIFFEVVLPGGILGVLAAFCILVATWFGYVEYGLLGALTVFFGAIIASCALIFIEFKVLAKTGFGQNFFLRAAVEGHTKVEKTDADIVGKKGVTLTRMNPSGMVAIDGKPYEAFSQDGFLEKDEPVTIVSRDTFKLIVIKS